MQHLFLSLHLSQHFKILRCVSRVTGIARERYRATTTADRYAGETKQNAEVTAKKQAACKPALPAHKVKFTVDRHRRLCARLCATHTRERTCVRSRYLPSPLSVLAIAMRNPRDAKISTVGRKRPQARLEYWRESLVRLPCQLVTGRSQPHLVLIRSVEISASPLALAAMCCVFVIRMTCEF